MLTEESEKGRAEFTGDLEYWCVTEKQAREGCIKEHDQIMKGQGGPRLKKRYWNGPRPWRSLLRGGPGGACSGDCIYLRISVLGDIANEWQHGDYTQPQIPLLQEATTKTSEWSRKWNVLVTCSVIIEAVWSAGNEGSKSLFCHPTWRWIYT